MMEIHLVRHGDVYTKEKNWKGHLASNGLNERHLTGRALNRPLGFRKTS